IRGFGYSSKLEAPPIDRFLAFSGGFDSIAAKQILSNDVPLASVNFGGNFAREYLWFKEFNPIIFNWNIRDKSVTGLKFNESLDWRWLPSPLLLLQKEGAPMSIYTGTIMEGAPFWFSHREIKFSGYTFRNFSSGIVKQDPISAI